MVYIEITGKVMKDVFGVYLIRDLKPTSANPILEKLRRKKVRCQITEIEETTISSDVEITEMKEL